MLTPEQVSQLPNDELNLGIAKFKYPEFKCEKFDALNSDDILIKTDDPYVLGGVVTNVNYCTNIADIWPLVVELGISLDFMGDGTWIANFYDWSKNLKGIECRFQVESKDPLRTYCECVFLVLQERANNNGGRTR